MRSREWDQGQNGPQRGFILWWRWEYGICYPAEVFFVCFEECGF